MSHRSTLRTAMFLSWLSLGACGNDWDGRWTTYRFSVKGDLASPVRLKADGELLGTCPPGGSFTLRRKDRGVRLSQRPEAITAELLTPDGWRPSGNILPDRRAPEWEEEQVKAGRSVDVNLTVFPGQEEHSARITLAVDNRDHPSCKVSLGAVSVEIPAGQSWREELPGPATTDGSIVRLNDREIGRVALRRELESRRKDRNINGLEVPWWLIDVGGTRTYSTRLVLYVPSGSFQGPRPPAKVRIQPALLHDLGFLNNVSLFIPAPSTTFGSSGYDSRYEILDDP